MTLNRAANRCAVISLLMLTASASVSDTKVHRPKRTWRPDDVKLVSLRTLVEQQASVIQTLQTQLTSQQTKVASLETNLKALQAKVDVTSSTVAFSARLSGDLDSGGAGLTLGHHQTLVFNEAITNVGNAYNTHTGIFTAPVAGTYAFFLSAMSTNNHGSTVWEIRKNGATLDLVFAEGKTDIYDQGSSLVSTQLAKGDHVWVRQEHGNAVRAGSWTIFTGYLLQAQ